MANNSHIAQPLQAVCSEQVAEPMGWRTCHKEGHTDELLMRLTCSRKGGISDCMHIAEAYRPAVKLIPKEDRACLAWAKPMSCYKQCSDLMTVSHIASALQRSRELKRLQSLACIRANLQAATPSLVHFPAAS